MKPTIKIDQKTITIELANAIASFNIDKVTLLLSEKGEYNILDDKNRISTSNKTNFISWLTNCIDEYLFLNADSARIDYIIDQCLHCKIGNPVIIFENGRFPVCTKNPWEREKCGLMLEFEDNLLSGITFCFVFLHTDNPYRCDI